MVAGGLQPFAKEDKGYTTPCALFCHHDTLPTRKLTWWWGGVTLAHARIFKEIEESSSVTETLLGYKFTGVIDGVQLD